MHRGSLQKHTEGEALPARHICSEDAFLLCRTLSSQTQSEKAASLLKTRHEKQSRGVYFTGRLAGPMMKWEWGRYL